MPPVHHTVPRPALRAILLAGLLAAGPAWGQLTIAIRGVKSFPEAFQDHAFTPAQLAVGAAGALYFLDPESHQLALVTATRETRFTGGFGHHQEDLFTPVAVLVSDLEVWVCDRLENRLVRFDQHLNYIGATHLQMEKSAPPLQPQLAAVDPWGHFLAYSQERQAIWKGNLEGLESLPFIDLAGSACLTSLDVSLSGDCALLDPCQEIVRFYNRLGRLGRQQRITVPDPRFVCALEDRWVVLNEDGIGAVLNTREARPLRVNLEDETILDLKVRNDRLYLLTNRQVLIGELVGGD